MSYFIVCPWKNLCTHSTGALLCYQLRYHSCLFIASCLGGANNETSHSRILDLSEASFVSVLWFLIVRLVFFYFSFIYRWTTSLQLRPQQFSGELYAIRIVRMLSWRVLVCLHFFSEISGLQVCCWKNPYGFPVFVGQFIRRGTNTGKDSTRQVART